MFSFFLMCNGKEVSKISIIQTSEGGLIWLCMRMISLVWMHLNRFYVILLLAEKIHWLINVCDCWGNGKLKELAWINSKFQRGGCRHLQSFRALRYNFSEWKEFGFASAVDTIKCFKHIRKSQMVCRNRWRIGFATVKQRNPFKSIKLIFGSKNFVPLSYDIEVAFVYAIGISTINGQLWGHVVWSGAATSH